MATRMQQRRGTAAEWAAQNPVLADGEIGFETDTKIIRVGDGVTPWNNLTLPYLGTGGGTMTGALNLIAPTQDAHAVRKVDLDTRTASLGLRDILTYTVDGTFVKANYPWLRAVQVTVVGGGGGGGGCNDTAVVGTGGGGAGAGKSFIETSILEDSVPIVVGAGGEGVLGAAGNAGGNSSFGTHTTGNGGAGGAPTNTQAPGSAGGTATGIIAIQGGRGGNAWVGSPTVAGYGGVPGFGLGTTEWNRISGSGGAGTPGRGFGAGGTGGLGSIAATGGLGAPGLVIVELYA